MSRKTIKFIIITFFILTAMILIGPMDLFVHGYFCDEVDYRQLRAEDFEDYVYLENGEYSMTISPQKNHLVGFEINLVNQPEGNTGNLILYVQDDNGSVLDTIITDLSKVTEKSWYNLYTSADLQKGKYYTLRFRAEDCSTFPYLQIVHPNYIPAETITGNVLICYAYAESTFTFQNKVIICLFLLTIWLLLFSFYIDTKKTKEIRTVSASVFMIAILSWNYMYNSMDSQNYDFYEFQSDSEALATGVIYADQKGTRFSDTGGQGYGLGRYYDLKGCFDSYDLTYLTDEKWLNGYSRSRAAIIVNSNIYSKSVAVVGNYISFKNGERFQINRIKDDEINIIIYLNSDSVLTSEKYGSLDEVVFYDSDFHALEKSQLYAYESQYGLQGKLFKHLGRHMEKNQIIPNLHLLCSILSAIVFTSIVVLISIKYNILLAGCYFVTFWLSPWIVNFARNLYWVEFTWFLPMATGLFCSWKIDSKKCRILSYIVTFVSIAGKCLCGYEYISAIMMGGIAFLSVDFCLVLLKGDRKKGILLFKAVVMTGIAALLGFMAAICVHALFKGNGNILLGIRNIFEQDVLRRTNGANLNEFIPLYWPSFNCSIWEVFCKYFHFSTEIITGIAGNLFPLLCLIPLFIFACEFKNNRLNFELPIMYIIFFFTSISWFCLAKSHSYIHITMNYVLWYFGFVQLCFYVVIHKLAELYNIILDK